MWYLASLLHLVFDLFSLPAGLHCLLKLGLTLFQAIKERHIDGREVQSTVDSGCLLMVQQGKEVSLCLWEQDMLMYLE